MVIQYFTLLKILFYWLFERMKHYSILYWLTISNLGIVISNLDLSIQAFKLPILNLELTINES